MIIKRWSMQVQGHSTSAYETKQGYLLTNTTYIMSYMDATKFTESSCPNAHITITHNAH
jgi:hypothetical protein